MKMYEEFELDLTNEKGGDRKQARGFSWPNILTMVTNYSIRNCTNGCDQVISPTHNKCNTVNTCRTLR